VARASPAAPEPTAPEPTAAEIEQLGLLSGAGRDAELESRARALIEAHPDSGIAWKALGESLRRQGKDARQALQNAAGLLPDDAEAHSNLGAALRSLGQPEAAAAAFRRALAIGPALAVVHGNLGNALRDLGRLDDAVASYRRALEINPALADVHNNLGNALHDLGLLDEAVASYRRALHVKPDHADAQSNLGSVLMHLGKVEEAEASLSKAIELSLGDARPLAAALLFIPYRQDDSRFDRLESVYARRASLPPADRIKLGFSMGKALEDIGEYARSFGAYEEANRLFHEGHPYDEAADERQVEHDCGEFTRAMFENWAAAAERSPPVSDGAIPDHATPDHATPDHATPDHATPDHATPDHAIPGHATPGHAIPDAHVPIFIVGMPRSGTSLIEQMLASHPAVFGAGELPKLGELAQKARLVPLGSPQRESTLATLRQLGQEYLEHIGKLAPQARYITDKMPGNYQYLWLIQLALPNAKIIHALRDPMDTCFSCYALRFTLGHEYSYDLRTLGRKYLRYERLMEHWHAALPPGRILSVSYEDNISDPEREVRRMLDHLGLAWNPACLRFYATERAVRTASAAQVRKPIYASSLARWRHFEQHLAPLRETIYS
jgi:Tfp pilus assembly protein PilF